MDSLEPVAVDEIDSQEEAPSSVMGLTGDG